MFCKKALVQGHRLTLFIRNLAKISINLQSNAKVEVIVGDMEDGSILAAQYGAEVFVSSLAF